MLHFEKDITEKSSYRLGIFSGLSCALLIFFSLVYLILTRFTKISSYLNYILFVMVIYLIIIMILIKKKRFDIK